MVDTKTTTLLLDIGGVLLSNGWDRKARRKAAATFELDHDEMEERHHLTFDSYERGNLSLDDYLERVVFHQTRPFPLAEFRRFMFEQSQPLPQTLDLMRELRDLYGFKIVAVSNEGRELAEHRIRTFGLDKLFDIFVVSSFVHARKPDFAMYRLALDLAQVAPEQAFYIDDRAMFVEVARGLGIRGIQHRDHEHTRQALAERGWQLLDKEKIWI